MRAEKLRLHAVTLECVRQRFDWPQGLWNPSKRTQLVVGILTMKNEMNF